MTTTLNYPLASPLVTNPAIKQIHSVYPSAGDYAKGYRASPSSFTHRWGRGAPVRPYGILDIVPYPSSTVSVASSGASTAYTQNTFLPLITTTTTGQTPGTIQGTACVYLDCPRTLLVRLGAVTNNTTINIAGYDYQGQAMTEQIQTGTTGDLVFQGNKAFWAVINIVATQNIANTGATPGLSVGVSNTFGLPYALQSLNHVICANWGTDYLPAAASPATVFSNDSFLNFGAKAVLNGAGGQASTTNLVDLRVHQFSIISLTYGGSFGYGAVVAGVVAAGDNYLQSSIVQNSPVGQFTVAGQSLAGTTTIFYRVHNPLWSQFKPAALGSPSTTTGIPLAQAVDGDVRGTVTIGAGGVLADSSMTARNWASWATVTQGSPSSSLFPVSNTATGIGGQNIPTGNRITVMYHIAGADEELDAELKSGAQDNPSSYFYQNIPLTRNLTGYGTGVADSNLIGIGQYPANQTNSGA